MRENIGRGSGTLYIYSSTAGCLRSPVSCGMWHVVCGSSGRVETQIVLSVLYTKHTHGYKLDDERQQQPYQEQRRGDHVEDEPSAPTTQFPSAVAAHVDSTAMYSSGR